MRSTSLTVSLIMLQLAVVSVCVAESRKDAPASGVQVRFAAEPKAVAEGKSVKITFALSAPIDVVVGVVNEKGVVIRHLAGGMLGPKAPKPLQAGKLAQALIWDRKDDRGKPVPAGKYEVQVQAGMLPKFERSIGFHPLALGLVSAVAAGPKGELFLANTAHNRYSYTVPRTMDLMKFSRDLEYLGTLKPYPGDLPYEALKGAHPIRLSNDRYIPRIFNIWNLGRKEHYPGMSGSVGRHMLAMPNGDLLLGLGSRLARIRAKDGAAPEPFELTCWLKKGEKASGAPQLALSKDGKCIYAAGVGTQGAEKGLVHAVYRWPVGKVGEPAEVFAGESRKGGDDPSHFWVPRGVAVDGDGNVLVSDWGNNRVVVFSSEGKFLKAFPASGPGSIWVNRKLGTVYCISIPHKFVFGQDKPVSIGNRIWRKKNLVKFVSWQDPRIAGQISLDTKGYYYSKPVIALDDQADPPILWIGENEQGALSRIIDKDPSGGLEKPKVAASAKMFDKRFPSCGHLTVDPVTERLYVCEGTGSKAKGPIWRLFDGNTGEPMRTMKMPGAEAHVGPDGRLYTYTFFTRKSAQGRKAGRGGLSICKWDRDGNPAPYEGTDSNWSQVLPFTGKPPVHETNTYLGGAGVWGFGVAPSGDVYVIYNRSAGYGRGSLWMCRIGPDGKLKDETLVRVSSAGCGPQIDRDGNIYILDAAFPEGMSRTPPEYASASKDPRRRRKDSVLFGTVIKFPPEGGGVFMKGTLPKEFKGETLRCQAGRVVDNAVWIRTHASPVEWGRTCVCFNGRSSLDRYGRLFVPVAAACKITVLDTEGNILCHFGRYGNVDNGGKESLRPIEGIPLNMGARVAVSDKAVYISDSFNRRVVKARLQYAVTGTCAAP